MASPMRRSRSSGRRSYRSPTTRSTRHSAGYGLVSYWTACAKAELPAEYMAAALLTSVKDDKDKSAIYLNECRRMGNQVLPPDVK